MQRLEISSQLVALGRTAQVLLWLAAGAGIGLTWVLFDWLGRHSEHCDYPEECLTSFFPSAFTLVQSLWLATMLLGGAAVVVAALARWTTQEVLLLGVAWVAVVVSVGTSPLYGGGEDMTRQQVEGNGFLGMDGTLPGAQVVALVTLAASMLFAIQAVRAHQAAVRTSAVG